MMRYFTRSLTRIEHTYVKKRITGKQPVSSYINQENYIVQTSYLVPASCLAMADIRFLSDVI